MSKQHMTPSEDDYYYASQLTSASVFPMVMQTAIELNLLDIISRAGLGAHLSAREIASQLPTKNPDAPEMVDRILRLLASYSVLTCTVVNHDNDDGHVQRLYGLAPVAKYYLPDQEEMSVTPALQMINDKVFMESWYALKDAVLEGGIPFNKVHGMTAFEYLGKDPRLDNVFNKAMTNNTHMVVNKVLEKYKGFENLKELLDVGGGLGLMLKIITSKYPNIKGINFDLPHVIQNAPPYPGVQHVQGDMFVEVPKAETIIMKGVLHDWTDDLCIKILKNCYAALPSDGKVISIEQVLPEVPEPNAATRFVYQIDLVMMTQHSGGKERTKQQFKSLAEQAGFNSVKFACDLKNRWIMEFCK